MSALHQNLAERPPRDTRRDLELEMGEASDYAADLLADADRADPGSVARARRRHRGAQLATAAIVIVLIAAGALGLRWWLTWSPDFVQDGQRLCAGPDGPECDQTGFVDNDLAELTQIPCTGTVTLTVGITTGSTVAVTDAFIPGVHSPGDPGLDDPAYGPRILLKDAQAWKSPDPSAFATSSAWPAVTGPWPESTELHVRLMLWPRPLRATPGNIQFIDSIQIDYQALGRDRTAILPLQRKIAVTVPAR